MRDIDAWARSRATTRLAESFGEPLSSADRLDDLERLSAAHWDFRGGRERNLAVDAALSPAQESLVAEVAPELGLADREVPAHDRYDAVVMTGGMVRAGIVKPRHVRMLVDHGLRTPKVVFLGGFRAFAGDEIPLARALGVRGDDEFAAMEAGLRRVFPAQSEPHTRGSAAEHPWASWSERTWRSGEHDIEVVAAPSSEPLVRRANTADTYRAWAASHPEVSSILLVTTPVYVPYQAAVAVEVLGLGCGIAVETVGVSAAANDLGEHTQPFRAQHHLQELRSAIRGMISLRAAAERH